MLPRYLQRNGWRRTHLWGALLLGVLAVAATWEAWTDIAYQTLRGGGFSQVLLAPAALVWLAWVRRERLRQCALRQQWVGVALILLGWLLCSGGYRLGIVLAWHLGALLTVLGAVTAVLGGDLLYRFLAPVTALLFLLPAPGVVRTAIEPPLQEVVSRTTHLIFEALGVTQLGGPEPLPLYEAVQRALLCCSSVKLLLALLLAGYTLALALPLRQRSRLLLLVVTPVLAVAGNVARTTLLVAAQGWQPNWTDNLATLLGWMGVGVGLAALWGLLIVLEWALVPMRRFTLAWD